MGKFVIDRLINSIIFIEDSEFLANKYKYKNITNSKLEIIMNNNYRLIKQIIINNNINGYYHLTSLPIIKLFDTSLKGTTYSGDTNLYYHPQGL
jgi:hypothetical protein